VGFLGWFGPRGAASIVFALLVVEEGGLPGDEILLATVFLTVALSVFAHGLTAAPLAARYADWLDTHPRDTRAPVESDEGHEVRWRLRTTTTTAGDGSP
jgi:NhaP-type Na+/H+ or K+/H+ antiporter